MEQQELFGTFKPLTENSKRVILDSISELQEFLQGSLMPHVRTVNVLYLKQLLKLIEDDMLWTDQLNQ